MASIIYLPSISDDRGKLTVFDHLEQLVPFQVKRIFFIFAVTDTGRGGHRHHTTQQVLLCINGSCTVTNHDGEKEEDFILDSPEKCLFLDTCDWHVMHRFSSNAILLVLASENYNAADYIYEPYSGTYHSELITSHSEINNIN